ncbi:unnamed protein product [Lymnaea stagnalis]|uniref:Uncharacterized protein n=1 Tax=Lymnaea stagnalis TaxID=6523 RepID=A0AAV2HRM2_LYMST
MTLSTKEEALEWKRRFEERSLTTHVKDKTFPKVERVSVFKAQYRCQFFDRRKNKKKLPEKSKFRDCHSILFINIKKYFKNTVDRHMPTFKTVVRLHYAHDHPLDTADVLKKRQLNEDIKQRFLEMFRQGMKPKDALDKHKRDLLQNLGPEKYRQVVCDGYYVPNVPKAYRLYYQIHGKGVSAKTTTKRSSRHNPNPDWIAFQNCPDITVEDEEDCPADEDNDDSDTDYNVGGRVENNERLQTDCQNMQSLPMTQSNPAQVSDGSIKDPMLSHDHPDTHTMNPKSTVREIVSQHSMLHHDGELQKLAETAIAYPNIAAHNSVYTDQRSQTLPQTMPVATFSETHMSMGLFNPAQSTWENFNLAHQANVASSLSPQHNLGFQHLPQPISHSSYMIMPNSSCQNLESHYSTSLAMIDPRVQNGISRTGNEFDLLGSSTAPQYNWSSHNRHQDNLVATQAHLTGHDVHKGKVLPTKYSTNGNDKGRKSSIKKAVQKKRKMTKELNVKRVTKRWMDKKPKVEAETQNMASEVLQGILLTDEAEKLKVKLLTFLSDLESKMSSNPKLFVPAIRSFLQAGEDAHDDLELASFLKDFRKTEESIVKKMFAKKSETRENRGTQTTLSGPVVRCFKVKGIISPTSKLRTKKKFETKITDPEVSESLLRSAVTGNLSNFLLSETSEHSVVSVATDSKYRELKTALSKVQKTTKKPLRKNSVPAKQQRTFSKKRTQIVRQEAEISQTNTISNSHNPRIIVRLMRQGLDKKK